MDKVSMSYLFSFSRYQTKCVIRSLFRQLMLSKTLGLVFDYPLSNVQEAEEEGKTEIQKCEYLKNE